MNRVALALHEFDSNEEVRRHVSDYRDLFDLTDLAGKRLPFTQWPLTRVSRGERFSDYEIQVQRRKAGRLWIGNYSGAPVQNKAGEAILSVVTVRDVTVKKRTEEALSTSVANLQEITNTIPVRVVRCSRDRRYLWVSEEYAKWLGRSQDEIVGRSLPEVLGPEAYETLRPYIEQTLTGQRISYEARVTYQGIGPRWVMGTYMPTYDPTGRADGWFGVLFDITEKKEMEEKLRHGNETLERRIRETVEELRQKDELLMIQGRMAIMAETISSIAHQWRQPLNTLALLAQELQMTCRNDGCSQEYLEGSIRRSLETIMHLSQTIDDFRYFVKPCSQVEEFKAHEVLEKTLSLLAASLDALKIRTEVEIVGESVLRGCPSQFSQVMLNILNNAREAFAARVVPDPRVVIKVYGGGGRTVMTVTDNAGGIPDHVIERIFDPYFTTKTLSHGTGIGLFLCKSIIDKTMNGSISVRNVGAGAEVRIEVGAPMPPSTHAKSFS